jgi:hypothetical protein
LPYEFHPGGVGSAGSFQKKLYKNVMRETFRSLAAVGKDITIPLLNLSQSKCFWVIRAIAWFEIQKRNILVNRESSRQDGFIPGMYQEFSNFPIM